MSTTIDERVVEMRFDNRQFETNIKDSIKSLDELKESLDLNTAATKLNNFISIFTTTFHGVQSIVSGVTNTIKGLVNEVGSLTGITQLISTQTSKMKQTLADLTGGAIASGFQEYELKLNSTRTILSNVEKNYDSTEDAIVAVTDALERLNKYADQTIYNFGEMTKNIGYFTVAGVDLETSVSAIKGISNLAALQGVESTAAARATYQLSQALSSGFVKLMDWRSLENAGMAGKQFQNMIIEIAKRRGVEYDKILAGEIDGAGKKKKNVKAYGSFRETLAEGWLTTDIMMEALQMYSGDFGDDFTQFLVKIGSESEYFQKALRGDADALEKYNLTLDDLDGLSKEDKIKKIAKAIGELNVEARENETIDFLIHQFSMTREKAEEMYALMVKANEAAKEVTTFTKLIDALKESAQSGWSQSWEIIIGGLDGAKKVWTKVNDEISGMLGRSAEKRNAMLKEWKESKDLLVNVYNADGTYEQTHMFFAAIGNFYEGVKGIAGHIKKVFSDMFGSLNAGTLISATQKFYDLSQKFKDFVNGTGEAGSGLEKLTPILTALGSVFSFVRDVMKSLRNTAIDIFKKILFSDEVSSGITTIVNGVSDLIAKLREMGIIEKIGTVLSSVIMPVIRVLGSAIKFVLNVISALGKKLSALGITDKIKGLFSKLGGWVTTAIEKVGQWADAIIAWLADSTVIQTAVDWVVKAVNWLGSGIEKAFTFIKGILAKVFSWFGEIDVKSVFKDLWNSIKNFFSNFGPNVKSLGSKIVKFFTNTAKKIWASIRKVFNWFGDTFTKVGGGVGSVFKKIFSGFTKGAKGTADGLAEGAETINNGVQNFLKKVLASLNSLVDLVLPTILKIGSAYTLFNTARMLGGMATLGRGLGKAGKQVAAGIKDFRKSGGFQSLAETISNPTFTSTKITKKIDSWPTTILKLTTSLALLVASVKVLSTIDSADFKSAMIRLGMIATGLVGLTVIFGILGKIFGGGISGDFSGVGKTLLSLSISLLSLVAVIKIFSTNFITDAEFKKGGVRAALVLGALAIAFAIIGAASKGAEKASKRSAIPFMKMVIALAALAGVIKLYSKFDFYEFVGGMAGVTVAMAALTTSMYFLGKAGKNGKKAVKPILKMCIAIGLLAVAVRMIGKMKTGDMIQGMFAITAFFIGLGVILRTAMRTKNPLRKSVSLFISLGAVVAAIWILADKVKQLGSLNTGTYAKGLSAIAVFMFGFKSIAKASKFLSWTSGLKIGAFVAEIALVFGLLTAVGGLLNQIPGFGDFMSGGAEVLAQIGESIGSFFGSMLEGFTSKFGLASLGQHLSDFGEKAAPFIKDFLPLLQGIPKESFEKLKIFSESIGALTGATSVNVGVGLKTTGAHGTEAWLGGIVEVAQDFEKYAQGISTLLGAMGTFLTEVGKITPQQVQSINDAKDTITDLFDAINNVEAPLKNQTGGGLLTWFDNLGGSFAGFVHAEYQDFVKYSDGISQLLQATGDFVLKVGEITQEKLSNLNSAKDTVIELFNTVADVKVPFKEQTGGGLFTWFDNFTSGSFVGFVHTENQDFAEYSDGISQLLQATSDFVSKVGEITPEKLSNLNAAKGTIIELFDAIASIKAPFETQTGGGFFTWFDNFASGSFLGYVQTENQDFAKYSDGISQLLQTTGDFIQKVGEITEEKKSNLIGTKETVESFFTTITEAKAPFKSRKAGGLGAWIDNFGGTFGGYVSEEYQEFSGYSQGISDIIAALGGFMTTIDNLGLDTTTAKFAETLGKIETFFQNTTDKELPKASEKTQDTSVWYTSYEDYGNGISSLIGACGNFIDKVSDLTDYTYPRFIEALGKVGQFFIDTISQTPAATRIKNGSAGIDTWYSTYSEYSSAMVMLLEEVENFIGIVTDNTDVLGEGGEFDSALKILTTFLTNTAKIQLPVIAQATFKSNEGADGSKLVDLMKTRTETFKEYGEGIGAILSASAGLLDVLKTDSSIRDWSNGGVYKKNADLLNEVAGSEDSLKYFEDALTTIGTFIGSVSKITLPTVDTESFKTWSSDGLAISDYLNVQSTNFKDLGEGLPPILKAAGELLDTLSQNGNLANLESLMDEQTGVFTSMLDNISTFLDDLSVKLPLSKLASILRTEDFAGGSATQQSIVGIATSFEDYGKFLGDLMESFGTFIDSILMSSYNQTLDEAGLAAAEFKFKKLTAIVQDGTLEWMFDNAKTFIMALNDIIPPAQKTVESLQDVHVDGVKYGNGTLTTVYDVEYSALNNLLTYLSNFINSFVKPDIDLEQTIMAIDSLTDFMNSINGMLQYLISASLSDTALGMFKNYDLAVEGWQNAFETMPDDFAVDVDAMASDAFNSIGQYLDDLLEWLGKLNKQIKDDTFALEDVKAILADMNGLLNALAVLKPEDYSSFFFTGKMVSGEITRGTAEGITETTSIGDALQACVNAAYASIASGAYSKFYTAGQNFAAGVAAGIRSGIVGVSMAATQLASAAIGAFNLKQESASPSRVMFQSGNWFAEGVALGITDGISEVVNASETLAQSAIDKVNGMSDIMSELFNLALNSEESGLSPVIDLSNFDIGDSPWGKALNLSVSRFMANQAYASGQSSQNGDVVKAINDMALKLDTLNEDLTHMQIVLDSGILAGSLTSKINKHLGNMVDSSKRRNAV